MIEGLFPQKEYLAKEPLKPLKASAFTPNNVKTFPPQIERGPETPQIPEKAFKARAKAAITTAPV